MPQNVWKVRLHHQHTRFDRDDWVEVMWDNLPGDAFTRKQFTRQPKPVGELPKYDYASIMHYGPRQFGNGAITLRGTKPGHEAMGREPVITNGDVEMARLLYLGVQRRG
ncbi:MAG: M12 family metallopeptidase [Polyangiales bacterium]